MTAEIRTLCDVFLSAAASGKPDLLTSKVGGRWTPISARDFGYTVRALSLGLNTLGDSLRDVFDPRLRRF